MYQNDDADILVGWPRMAEFAQATGYKITRSTLAKRGSPAINTGPELVGYFGQLPASTKGRIRAWLQAQLQPERPPSKRWAGKDSVGPVDKRWGKRSAAGPAGESA
jgi:hypothetical protein